MECRFLVGGVAAGAFFRGARYPHSGEGLKRIHGAFWIVCAAALLASTPSDASKACMGRAEAKKAFGGAYLLWHRNSHGRRCYSPREAVAFMPQRGIRREKDRGVDEIPPIRPTRPVNRDAAEIVTLISSPLPQRFFDERFQGVREVTSRTPSFQPATINRPTSIKPPEQSVSAAGALFALAAVLGIVSALAWWLAGGQRKLGTVAADQYAGRPSRATRIPGRCSRVLAPWAWGG
jgi:hypothetical protein